jgi:hypothetical protein
MLCKESRIFTHISTLTYRHAHKYTPRPRKHAHRHTHTHTYTQNPNPHKHMHTKPCTSHTHPTYVHARVHRKCTYMPCAHGLEHTQTYTQSHAYIHTHDITQTHTYTQSTQNALSALLSFPTPLPGQGRSEHMNTHTHTHTHTRTQYTQNASNALLAFPTPLPGLGEPATLTPLITWACGLLWSPRMREADAGVCF